jgi:hypothetical protein
MKMKARYLVSYRSQAFFTPALKAELQTGAVAKCAGSRLRHQTLWRLAGFWFINWLLWKN